MLFKVETKISITRSCPTSTLKSIRISIEFNILFSLRKLICVCFCFLILKENQFNFNLFSYFVKFSSLNLTDNLYTKIILKKKNLYFYGKIFNSYNFLKNIWLISLTTLHNSFYIATVIRIIQLNVTTADEIHFYFPSSMPSCNCNKIKLHLFEITKVEELDLLKLAFSLIKSFYFNACSLFDFMLATVSFFFSFSLFKREGTFSSVLNNVVIFMIGL